MDITGTNISASVQNSVDRSKMDRAKEELQALKSSTSGQNAEAIKKSAQEFEAVFMEQMLNHMWSGVSTDGPFGGGHAEQTFRGLLVNEYAREMTKSGGLGIADQVEQELLRLQEIKK